MPSPFDQSAYQIRLEWGVAGLARLAPSDVVVVVDVLRYSTDVMEAVERGETPRLGGIEPGDRTGAGADPGDGAAIAEAAANGPALVLLGALRNTSAVATAILAEQERRGDRTSIAVIATGEPTAPAPGAPLRFAVEDHFGAGAIVSALTDLGIDHCSPEAAAASEGFRALRRAMKHLLSSSGSGRELAERGHGDEVAAAAALDASTVVPVLRDGVFRAL